MSDPQTKDQKLLDQADFWLTDASCEIHNGNIGNALRLARYAVIELEKVVSHERP